MFAQAAICIRGEHRRLSELDSVGGDGDHGTTMLRVAEQLDGGVDPASTPSLADFLRAVGWRVMGIDGGASSALLGTFIAGMADLEAAGDTINCDQFAGALEAGLRAVSKHTKAQAGDKTMMDALIPAVAALKTAAACGEPIQKALADSASAAWRGAGSTKDLVARYGRAKLLGEKTRGYPDAGATSIALLFKGFSQGLKEEENTSHG